MPAQKPHSIVDELHKLPDKTPRWAIGLISVFAGVLTASVTAILALTPMIRDLAGIPALREEILRGNAQMEGMRQIVGQTVSRLSASEDRASVAEKENSEYRRKVSDLEIKLAEVSKISARDKAQLQSELEKLLLDNKNKEKRIAELEVLLAKLTDKKFESIR